MQPSENYNAAKSAQHTQQHADNQDKTEYFPQAKPPFLVILPTENNYQTGYQGKNGDKQSV